MYNNSPSRTARFCIFGSKSVDKGLIPDANSWVPSIEMNPAGGYTTFGFATGQQVNIRPGQSNTGDAIWLQNTDDTRPFLVMADGTVQADGYNFANLSTLP